MLPWQMETVCGAPGCVSGIGVVPLCWAQSDIDMIDIPVFCALVSNIL